MIDQKGVSAIAVVLVLLLLLILAGGGFYAYNQKQSENFPPTTTFDNVDLNEDVVVFLFQTVPRLYTRVVLLNNDLTLIAAELERIDELQDEYPSGKRYIETERMAWIKLQKNLTLSVQSAQSAAESYYVAYMVNNEKGRELISDNVGDLVSDIDDALKESGQETRRLKTVSNQTLMERLKGLF
jgi:hypothetical protein